MLRNIFLVGTVLKDVDTAGLWWLAFAGQHGNHSKRERCNSKCKLNEGLWGCWQHQDRAGELLPRHRLLCWYSRHCSWGISLYGMQEAIPYLFFCLDSTALDLTVEPRLVTNLTSYYTEYFSWVLSIMILCCLWLILIHCYSQEVRRGQFY